MEIKAIENLLTSLLGDDKKFVSADCKKLLSHGENYGSVMLDLKVTLQNKYGREEIVKCVAKTCPPLGILWTVFNTPATFKKEIDFYRTLVPTLNDFGRKNGIELVMPFFANYYGARISLNPNSNQVDSDAVLLLENVKSRGFGIGDRYVGFNMEETKLLLRNLATFHAVPLAYKLKYPDKFNEKIQPCLKQDFKFNIPPDAIESMILICKDISSTVPQLASTFPRVEQNLRRYLDDIFPNPFQIREAFATVVHNDFWVNNTMLRYENGIPVESIMVDFQCIDYNSPAHDLVFFLYTSVELSLIKGHFDDFVKYYFDIFIETLKRFGCATEEFAFEKFVKEMGIVAEERELYHVIMMSTALYTKKEEAVDLKDIEEMVKATSKDTFHENFRDKLIFILSDFKQRGWI